jgi:hypothetical protein
VDPSKSLSFPFQYISNIDKLLTIKGKGKSTKELLDLSLLEEALAVRAAVLVRDTATAIAASKAPKQEAENELFAQFKVDMTRAHFNYLVFTIYRKKVES